MPAEQNKEVKEKLQIKGKLVVVTGPSGAGKDAVYEELLKIGISDLGFNWITTCATREKRLNKQTGLMEVDGVDYHFVTEEELFRMHADGELVENPVQTGKSWKATSKKALLNALELNHALWRVDLTLASSIEKGVGGFMEKFDPETAHTLSKSTMVVYIDVDKETLEARRLRRANLKTKEEIILHNEEFAERDRQEMDIVNRVERHIQSTATQPRRRAEPDS